MRRGEIYYADLTPMIGAEINKRRPVLIVSNDANNRVASTVTVLPITSNVNRVYPFELLLAPKESGLPKPSKAQAQQIRTISKERVRGGAVGRLNIAVMRKAEDEAQQDLSPREKAAQKRIGDLRRRLLDLSNSNRLLNYKV